MSILAVIPARYSSTRLPGKPLKQVDGKPLIWHVYNQATKIKGIDSIIVATDDNRIKETCEYFDIPCILTSKDHNNGTERVCELFKS